MNESQIRKNLEAIVGAVIDDMEPHEIAAINLCLLLNQDPRNRAGWDKVEHLFTEDGKMHEMTEDAFIAVATQRLRSLSP